MFINTYTHMTESLFVKAFGDYPMIRVLDFLLENRTFNYSKSEIAENADVSRTTLDGLWEGVVAEKIIAKTREVGRAVMYKFNPDSPISKKLIELDFVISKQFADTECAKADHKVPVAA